MQANTGNVCAQLTSAQLENGFTYTEETYNNTAWLKYAASILFMGGITNTFSQANLPQLTPVKTEQTLNKTSKPTYKDSINIRGSIINAISNKPLTYPMLVELQSENRTLTQTISSETGSFNLLISNKENLEKIRVILHYQNSKNDTIQVPIEHVSFEKLQNVNEYRLVVRTAVNTLLLPNKVDKPMSIRDDNGVIFYVDGLIRMDKPIKAGGIKMQEVQIIPNGTPANLETKPIDQNTINR